MLYDMGRDTNISQGVLGLFWILDLLFMLLLPLGPNASLPWGNSESNVVTGIWSFLGPVWFVPASGVRLDGVNYDWVGLFATLAAWMGITVLMAVWLTLSHAGFVTSYTPGWMIVILRYSARLAVQALWLPIMLNLVSPFDCPAKGNWYQTHVQCWSGAHIGLVVASCIILPCTLVWHLLVSVTYVNREPDFTGKKNLLAAPHGRVQAIMLMFKTAMAVFYVFGSSALNAWVYLIVVLAGGLAWAWLYLTYLPYHNRALNGLQCAAASAFCSAAVCGLVAEGLGSAGHGAQTGAISWLLLLPGMLFTGWALVAARTRSMAAGTNAASHEIELSNPYFVDVRVRCMVAEAVLSGHDPRASTAKDNASNMAAAEKAAGVYAAELGGGPRKDEAGSARDGNFLGRESGTSLAVSDPEAEAVRVEANRLWYEANRAFNNSGMLSLFWAGYQATVTRNAHLERLRLRDAASKADWSQIDVHFFCRSRLRDIEQDEARSGRSKMNVDRRMEYEKLQFVSRAAVVTARANVLAFWAELAAKHPDLQKLKALGLAINSSLTAADTTFRDLLVLAPQNATIMRLYADFLLELANDPRKAQELLTDAEQIEEDASKVHLSAITVNVVTGLSCGEFDLTADSVALIKVSSDVDRMGAIYDVNGHACKLFGYSRRELLARTLSDLVPSPIGPIHNLIVQRFLETGTVRMMGANRITFIQHRAGYMLPAKMNIRASLDGFAAVLDLLPTPPGEMYLWSLGPAANWRITAACEASMGLLGIDVAALKAGTSSLTRFLPVGDLDKVINQAEDAADRSVDAGVPVEFKNIGSGWINGLAGHPGSLQASMGPQDESTTVSLTLKVNQLYVAAGNLTVYMLRLRRVNARGVPGGMTRNPLLAKTGQGEVVDGSDEEGDAASDVGVGERRRGSSRDGDNVSDMLIPQRTSRDDPRAMPSARSFHATPSMRVPPANHPGIPEGAQMSSCPVIGPVAISGSSVPLKRAASQRETAASAGPAPEATPVRAPAPAPAPPARASSQDEPFDPFGTGSRDSNGSLEGDAQAATPSEPTSRAIVVEDSTGEAKADEEGSKQDVDLPGAVPTSSPPPAPAPTRPASAARVSTNSTPVHTVQDASAGLAMAMLQPSPVPAPAPVPAAASPGPGSGSASLILAQSGREHTAASVNDSTAMGEGTRGRVPQRGLSFRPPTGATTGADSIVGDPSMRATTDGESAIGRFQPGLNRKASKGILVHRKGPGSDVGSAAGRPEPLSIPHAPSRQQSVSGGGDGGSVLSGGKLVGGNKSAHGPATVHSNGSGTSATSITQILRRGVMARTGRLETSLRYTKSAVLGVFCIIAILNLTSMLVTQQLLFQMYDNLSLVYKNGQRAVLSQRIYSAVQAWAMAQAGLAEQVDMSIQGPRIGAFVDQFEALHQTLYLAVDGSLPEEKRLYTSGSALTVDDLIPGQHNSLELNLFHTRNRTLNLGNVGIEFTARARRILQMNVSDIQYSDLDVFWIVNNGGRSIREGLNYSMMLADLRSEFQGGKMKNADQVILVVSEIVFLVIMFLVMLPAVLKVVASHHAVFETFIQVPLPIIRAMRSSVQKRIAAIARAEEEAEVGIDIGGKGNELDEAADDEMKSLLAKEKGGSVGLGSQTARDTEDEGEEKDPESGTTITDALRKYTSKMHVRNILAAANKEAAADDEGAEAEGEQQQSAKAGQRKGKGKRRGSVNKRSYRRAGSDMIANLFAFIWPIILYMIYFALMWWYKGSMVDEVVSQKASLLWQAQAEMYMNLATIRVRFAAAGCDPAYLSQQLDDASSDLAFAEYLVDAVLYGSDDRNMKSAIQVGRNGLPQLWMSNGCVANDGWFYSMEECKTFGSGITAKGLLGAFRSFGSYSRQLIQDRRVMIGNQACVPIRMNDQGSVAYLVNKFGSALLSVGFARASELQFSAPSGFINEFYSSYGIIVALTILALVGFWYIFYVPLVSRLDKDIKNVRTLLLLFPDEVARSVPAIVAAGRQMLAEAGSSAGSVSSASVLLAARA